MPVCYSLNFMVGIGRDTRTIGKICVKNRHSSVQSVTSLVNVFVDDVTCSSRELWEFLMFIFFNARVKKEN